jgi:ABC-type Na+ transport system ATPase subunit NatA
MSKQSIALNIEGLTKVYKNGVEAVKGVDLQVDEGDFFALLGPNGAGKSTPLTASTPFLYTLVRPSIFNAILCLLITYPHHNPNVLLVYAQCLNDLKCEPP